MADQDAKVSLGFSFDFTDVQRDADKLGSVISQSISKAVSGALSGQTLGSGMAPTSMSSSGKAPHREIVDVLEKIHQTLTAGLGAGAAPPPGTGPTGPGQSGKPDKGPPPGMTPDPRTGGYRPEFRLNRAMGYAGLFPQQAYANMLQSNFYSTDVAGFAAQALSNVPVLNQLTGMVQQGYEERDRFLGESTNAFRRGGFQSRDVLRSMTQMGARDADENDDRRSLMGKTGVTRSEVAAMVEQMSGYGKPSIEGLQNLMKLQGFLGLGDKGIGVMGAMRRGGSDIGEHDAFAQSLATAIGQNLDRGRWGEAFSAIARSAETISALGGDARSAFQMQQFVGSAGGRFTGDTTSNASMSGMMTGMLTGQGGGMANVFALQAAGMGQTDPLTGKRVSYSEALFRVQTGQVDLKTLIDRYRSVGAVKQYLDDPRGPGKLQGAAVFLWTVLGRQYKMGDIAGMLTAMSSDRMGRDFTAGAERMLNIGLPGSERDLAQRAASKSLIGTGTDVAGMPNEGDNSARTTEINVGSATSGLPRGTTFLPEAEGNRAFIDAAVPSRGGKFGAQRSGGPHPGIDIESIPPGGSVYVPSGGDGKVILARPGQTADEQPGNLVLIQTKDGRVLHFAHLMNVQVSQGQTVHAGQKLGEKHHAAFWIGKGGAKTPSHVHFGVDHGRGTAPIDPASAEAGVNLNTLTNVPGSGAGGVRDSSGKQFTIGGMGVVSVTIGYDPTVTGVDIKQKAQKAQKKAPGQLNGSKR